MNRTLAGTAAVATATVVALGGYATDAAQPLADSKTCSDIGTNYCAPAAAAQSDGNDPTPDSSPVVPNGIEARPPALVLNQGYIPQPGPGIGPSSRHQFQTRF